MAADASKSPARSRRLERKSGVVVPHQPTFLQWLAAWILFLMGRAVMLTLRYSWNDAAGAIHGKAGGPFIFAIWHNRLALCFEANRVYRKHRKGAGFAALVSASKDGGFLAAILERFKIQPVRGSSSRRGPQALLELTSWAERGYDLAITPDGPRGPCYVIQEGIMSLAQLTGLPVVPFSYNLQWKIRLKSWDRFQIPLPFSKCEMNVGQPIHVPRDVTDEQRAELRRRLETVMKEMTRE